MHESCKGYVGSSHLTAQEAPNVFAAVGEATSDQVGGGGGGSRHLIFPLQSASHLWVLLPDTGTTAFPKLRSNVLTPMRTLTGPPVTGWLQSDLLSVPGLHT